MFLVNLLFACTLFQNTEQKTNQIDKYIFSCLSVPHFKHISFYKIQYLTIQKKEELEFDPNCHFSDVIKHLLHEQLMIGPQKKYMIMVKFININMNIFLISTIEGLGRNLNLKINNKAHQKNTNDRHFKKA